MFSFKFKSKIFKSLDILSGKNVFCQVKHLLDKIHLMQQIQQLLINLKLKSEDFCFFPDGESGKSHSVAG